MIKWLVWIHIAAGIPAFAQVLAFSTRPKGQTVFFFSSRKCFFVS